MPYCIKCGRRVKPGANFCYSCGHQVVAIKKERDTGRPSASTSGSALSGGSNSKKGAGGQKPVDEKELGSAIAAPIILGAVIMTILWVYPQISEKLSEGQEPTPTGSIEKITRGVMEITPGL